MKKIIVSLASLLSLLLLFFACKKSSTTATTTVVYNILTVVGNGSKGFGGDGGQAVSAELNSPNGVALDAAGNLYIADAFNHVIRKVNTAGVITTVAGNGTAGFSGDSALATSAQLNQPSAVAIDAQGNMYIADNANNRIRKVATSGIIYTIAGTATGGFSGDGAAASAAQLAFPAGIAVDGTGAIYIADAGNSRIRKINTTGVINTVAGTITSGYSGDNGMATAAKINYPTCVILDGQGNIYFTDYNNQRIRKINTSGIIYSIVGSGVYGFYGDAGYAVLAQLRHPQSIAIDGSGNLFIADHGSSRIRSVNTAGIINTVAGTGGVGFAGDGGYATAAEFDGVCGITVDAAGNLYVADNANNRIRKINP